MSKSKENMQVLNGFNGIPFNLLIDPQGKIIAIGLRGEELIKKLGEILRQKN